MNINDAHPARRLAGRRHQLFDGCHPDLEVIKILSVWLRVIFFWI
jgi:hypothetical protein